MENREPNVYGARPSYPSYPSRPHRGPPSYGHMDEYFKVDHYYSKKYPTKRHAKPYYEKNSKHKYPTPSYGHSYHKGMNYMNPMDYNHNPKDVDLFRPTKYEIHEPFHKESQGFYDEPSLDHHLQHQDFFVDIPKINIASAIGNKKMQKLDKKLCQKLC